MADTITVKVVRVPGAVTEVALESGATVADAMAAAGVTAGAGETVSVNGQTVDTSNTVNDGSRIIVAKGAKGA